MYTERLDGFIDAILADGELTDKELIMLRRVAESEGFDADEVEIYVEGRLAMMKKNGGSSAQQEQGSAVSAHSVRNVEQAPVPPNGQTPGQMPPPPGAPGAVPPPPPVPNATPKPTKHGELRKCPACGEPVVSGSVQCQMCGYTFTGIEAVSSAVRFAEMINRIEESIRGEGGIMSGIASLYGMDSRSRKLTSAINNFPVPNTREDLLEFILYLKPRTTLLGASESSSYVRMAYQSKYKECVGKAKVFFPNDPQIQEAIKKEKKKGLFNLLRNDS